MANGRVSTLVLCTILVMTGVPLIAAFYFLAGTIVVAGLLAAGIVHPARARARCALPPCKDRAPFPDQRAHQASRPFQPVVARGTALARLGDCP